MGVYREEYLKDFLYYTVAFMSAKLIKELTSENVLGDASNLSGTFSCKLDYMYNERCGNILGYCGYEIVRDYLQKYGITLQKDGVVSKEVTKEEVEKSFLRAKEKSPEMIAKMVNREYIWRKYDEGRHIYSTQLLLQDIAKDRECTKEDITSALVDEATFEIQVYMIDAKEYALRKFFDYLMSKIPENKDTAQITLMGKVYSKPLYDRDMLVPEESFDVEYLKMTSFGVKLSEFIKYAEDKGYSVKIHKNPQETYLYFSPLKKLSETDTLNAQPTQASSNIIRIDVNGSTFPNSSAEEAYRMGYRAYNIARKGNGASVEALRNGISDEYIGWFEKGYDDARIEEKRYWRIMEERKRAKGL